MARRLFSFTSTRHESGELAAGVTYVVYTNAAGTVLADISATVGGGPIAGSTVTTADLAGKGLAAAVFYGPTDGTTNLFLRCPAGPSLGVQEVQADSDARLDALEAGGSVSAHEADTTAIHGIVDTSQLAVRNAANVFTASNRFTSGEPWWDARAYGTNITAIQTAIDQAAAAGGGVVRIRGAFSGNATAISLKDNVHLRGDGPSISTITFTELGAGQVAIREMAGAAGFANAPTISDIGFIGPSNPVFTLGVAPALMDGIEVGTRWELHNVWVGGFRAGFKILRDHQVFDRCKGYNCYYNVYFAHSPLGKGNQYFLWCDFTGATFASIGVCSGDNSIDAATFIGGHGGFAPYVFYHETGTSVLGLMSLSGLYGFAFEAVGNAAFLDESSGGGSGADTLFAVTMHNPGFSWLSNYKIAARHDDYSMDVRNITDVEIFGGTGPFSAGDVGTWRITGSAGVTLKQRTAPALITGPADGISLELENGIKARVRQAAGTITAKDLLEGGQSQVARYGTTDRGSFAGVALNNGTVGTNVGVAHTGRVNVVANTAVATGGVPLVPDEANLVQVKPVPSTGANGYQFGSATAVPNKHPIVGTSDRDIAAAATGNMWIDVAPNRTYVAPGAVTALPTASAAYRGQLLRVEGGGGAADVTYQCLKAAAGTYSWVTVATG